MREEKPIKQGEIPILYATFRSPITELDCGKKCAPYNENGVPFCCDTNHAVPTAYHEEWEYLKKNTDLWHPWEGEDEQETQRLRSVTPDGQSLIGCLGHQHCQRDFRALSCRSFPFYPYITEEGAFTGLSYYWDFEDRCWVINNLHVVHPDYRQEFISTFDMLFQRAPGERENFLYHSQIMRQIFAKRRRAIPLLHRNGENYKVTPSSGKMRRTTLEKMPKFGVYKIAAGLPFPGE
jgi:hypothetical protein